MNTPQHFRRYVVLILLLALAGRLILLASASVSFHSDEAIIGLMARHINQGKPIPIFFYGQAYMGSLDPLLVSLMFRLTGESVLGIRLVQVIIYLAILVAALALAYQISGKQRIALAVGLLMAFPPVVMTVYTTISLGGYEETVLFGTLILLVAYRLRYRNSLSWRDWLALGALTGLGWWVNSLIVAFVAPAGILLVTGLFRTDWKQQGIRMLGAGIAFLIFSSPWWFYNVNHNWESIQFLLNGFQSVSGSPIPGVGDKLTGLLLLGLPAVFGARYPWTTGLWASAVVAIPIVLLYLTLLVISGITAARKAQSIRSLWLAILTFTLIFVFSSFGVDSTGRYLLPFIIPIMILVVIQANGRWLWYVVGVLVAFNLTATALAIRNTPPGLTPQFDPITDFPNTSDQAVIDFLQTHGTHPGTQYGYGTYWVSYRLAFLSHETVILSPLLPYKAGLEFVGPDRYPAYTAEVQQTVDPLPLVTANHPTLDTLINQQLTQRGITFSIEKIGPYTVFYKLSARFNPNDLDIGTIH